MRSPDVKIMGKEDCTPALLDLCKSARASCCGTFQRVNTGAGERILPCIGRGLLVSEFYESESEAIAQDGFMDALAGMLGVMDAQREKPKMETTGEVVKIAHIVSTIACPCEEAAEEKVEEDTLKTELSVEKIWTPNEKQLAGLRAFRDEHRSLYIYGPPDTGKTYLAYLCAKAYKGRKTVFTNTKLSEFFRKNSHELQPADFKGLVICDDLQENLPTPFFQSALFEALDLVKRRRIRLIIVANLTPQEFVERYAVEELRRPQFEYRFSKMEMIKL